MNHTKWVLQKYQMNACGMTDGLSGDMLASSWRNLAPTVLPPNKKLLPTPLYSRTCRLTDSHPECFRYTIIPTESLQGRIYEAAIPRNRHFYRQDNFTFSWGTSLVNRQKCQICVVKILFEKVWKSIATNQLKVVMTCPGSTDKCPSHSEEWPFHQRSCRGSHHLLRQNYNAFY